jgi:hypothetical protein
MEFKDEEGARWLIKMVRKFHKRSRAKERIVNIVCVLLTNRGAKFAAWPRDADEESCRRGADFDGVGRVDEVLAATGL